VEHSRQGVTKITMVKLTADVETLKNGNCRAHKQTIPSPTINGPEDNIHNPDGPTSYPVRAGDSQIKQIGCQLQQT